MPRLATEHLAAIQLAVRASVAAGVAVLLAQWLGLPYPIYALIAAIIVMDRDPKTTRGLALRRLAGTFIGAVLGALASSWLEIRPIAIAASVLVAMLLCHALKLDGAARLSGYTSAIVLLGFSADPWRYALARFVETVLGIAVALAVSLVPKLVTVEAKAPDA
jgi:uncharacterized membrane protein YgaE (UPF0421/DUF939 family)